MRKYVLSSLLLILVVFSVIISPLGEIAQYSFESNDESVISTVDTIADTDVITQSVQTVIQKWQTKVLFSSSNTTHDLNEKFISFKFINHVFLPKITDGFISVVHHQSNYL